MTGTILPSGDLPAKGASASDLFPLGNFPPTGKTGKGLPPKSGLAPPPRISQPGEIKFLRGG